MEMLMNSDREYWRGVLGAGGFTAIPRWTGDSTPGVAEHREPIPDDLSAALHRLADSSALPLSALLLATHAAVLSALSGERSVATGYVAVAGDRPLPCRLSTGSTTWRELIEQAQRVETELLAHHDFPVDALVGELGLIGPLFETVLDPVAGGGRARRAHRAVGGHRPVRGPAGPAAALSDERAGRRGRRPDRRLPPHGARATGRRPRCRPAPAEPAVRRRARLPARRAGRTAPRATRSPVPRAVRAAGGRAPGRRRGGARRPAVDLRGAQRPRQPAGPGSAGPRAAATKAWSRWWPSATWTGWPPSSRSSRPAGCTCPSNRTSRPTASRPRSGAPDADWC